MWPFCKVANIEHQFRVAKGIRHQLDAIDDLTKPPVAKKASSNDQFCFGNVMLASRANKGTSYATIEQQHSKDPAYACFHIHLAKYLNELMVALDANNGKRIVLRSDDMVCILQFQTV